MIHFFRINGIQPDRTLKLCKALTGFIELSVLQIKQQLVDGEIVFRTRDGQVAYRLIETLIAVKAEYNYFPAKELSAKEIQKELAEIDFSTLELRGNLPYCKKSNVTTIIEDDGLSAAVEKRLIELGQIVNVVRNH